MTEHHARRERSPGIKLLFAALIGLALMIPQLLVYALVYDRQDQSSTAQASINAGWGGQQIVAGPVLVVPYPAIETQNETVGGKTVTRSVEVERELFVSPVTNTVDTVIVPQERNKSIYRAVLFEAQVKGRATFALPADLPRFGVPAEKLEWERAELRMGASDARGLTRGGRIVANGRPLAVEPGKGLGAAGNQGFFAFVPWQGEGQRILQPRPARRADPLGGILDLAQPQLWR